VILIRDENLFRATDLRRGFARPVVVPLFTEDAWSLVVTRAMSGVVPLTRDEVYIDMPTGDKVSRGVTDWGWR
jgi:hypothetical protein